MAPRWRLKVQKAIMVSAKSRKTPEYCLYPNGIVQFPKEEALFYAIHPLPSCTKEPCCLVFTCNNECKAHHKVTKDNSDSTTSKVTLHTCANMQPEATATVKQLKLLNHLLNHLCHFPP